GRLLARQVELIRIAAGADSQELLALARALSHDLVPIPSSPHIEVELVQLLAPPPGPPSPSGGGQRPAAPPPAPPRRATARRRWSGAASESRCGAPSPAAQSRRWWTWPSVTHRSASARRSCSAGSGLTPRRSSSTA